MKKLLYIIAAMAMTLTACNKEAADPTDQGKKGTPLVIDVAVVSPTSPTNSVSPASPSTRATDTGYDTAFEVGDAIGIWVYEGATTYTNKKWERQTDGTWKPAAPADNIYYNGTAMTIKAYFPYDENATALPEAATFTVQEDQSTLANYRASDLLLSTSQTWGGTATTLPLTFAHAMAMVEAVPSSTADLQSVTMAAKTSDGATAATALTFYKFGDGTYRALLPAQDLATSLFFNYTAESYAFLTTTALAGGSYYKYGVTTLPAAIGDYYYSDGSYSATLNTAKTCVGIVFRAQTDALKGLVVSLDETQQAWSTEYSNTGTGTTDGAANMATIAGYLTDNSKPWSTFPAFEWVYTTKNGGRTTPWYLPAKDELLALYAAWNGGQGTLEEGGMRTTFNGWLSAAGGKNMTSAWYWSSSELDTYLAWIVSFDYGDADGVGKSIDHNIVRAVLAF